MNPLTRIDPDDPYPESDGEPMAENTLQFDWIVRIKENLEIMFAARADVFVAGNLFWYPVADRHVIGPLAPDAMVVFGRSKGPRGSYRQWEEGGIAPQVVFEVRSPSNSAKELRDKFEFYDTYGVEEYYLIDPERGRFEVALRQDGRLRAISHLGQWTSPRLQVRFVQHGNELTLYDPTGRPFQSPLELATAAEAAEARAEQAEARERAAEQALAQLRARLRALGIDPDDGADPG